MRRQYFYWTYLVISILLISYGGFMLIYNFNHGKGLSILCLVCLIIGLLMLALYLALAIYSYLTKKKRANIEQKDEEEKVVKEPEQVEQKEEVKVDPIPEKKETTYRDDVQYERTSYTSSSSIYDCETVYVRLVGYGPVLRISGNRILDMRSNTYYRIEGNYVYQDGSGLAFEISGNRIKPSFGSYLYEISGSNINKVFGGYFASISGNMITKYDLSEKYELSSSISLRQQLVITILLFGTY